MSDERYIKVSATDIRAIDLNIRVALRWAAAQGQRVETIRWCVEHNVLAGLCVPSASCVVVKASLILPPADAPHA